MDAVLIILLLMGICSITLALYILADAKRGYGKDGRDLHGMLGAAGPRYRERSKRDRRSGQAVNFPLLVDGVLIREDRRKLPDRRQPVLA